MVEMELGRGGAGPYSSRCLVRIAAEKATLHRLDRREGERSASRNGAVRKGGDSAEAHAGSKDYFVTGCNERLSMMWSMMPYSSAWTGSRI